MEPHSKRNILFASVWCFTFAVSFSLPLSLSLSLFRSASRSWTFRRVSLATSQNWRPKRWRSVPVFRTAGAICSRASTSCGSSTSWPNGNTLELWYGGVQCRSDGMRAQLQCPFLLLPLPISKDFVLLTIIISKLHFQLSSNVNTPSSFNWILENCSLLAKFFVKFCSDNFSLTGNWKFELWTFKRLRKMLSNYSGFSQNFLFPFRSLREWRSHALVCMVRFVCRCWSSLNRRRSWRGPWRSSTLCCNCTCWSCWRCRPNIWAVSGANPTWRRWAPSIRKFVIASTTTGPMATASLTVVFLSRVADKIWLPWRHPGNN